MQAAGHAVVGGRTRWWRGLGLVGLLLAGACGGGGGEFPPAEDPDAGLLGEVDIDESSLYLIDALDERFDEIDRAPLRADTSGHLPPVGNQLNQGSCVGWATAYYTKTAQEHKELGWDTTAQNHIFSPAYVYNQRANSGEGMAIDNACQILVSKGCCTLATQPYDPSRDRGLNNPAADNEAANFKAQSFRRFGTTLGSLPDSALEEIRSFLSTKDYPVIFGVNVYRSFADYRGGNVLSNVRDGSLLGGHAIAVVGYDDTISGGAFKIVNSWGPNWGAQGFAWIPYSSMRQIFKYAFGLVDKPNTGGPPPPVNPTDSGNNTIAGAGVIASGETKNGAVGNQQDDPADWWKFTVTAGARADIALGGMTSDVDVKLATAQDVRLASSTLGGTASESISYTFSSAGTYYIKVYPYDNLQSPYSLSLTVTSGETNDTPSGASTLALNTSTNGFVGGTDVADWWKVSLSAGQTLEATLTGLSQDIDIQVYDPSLNFVGGSYLGGSASESVVFNSGSGGTWYVKVYPYASAQSSYTVRVGGGGSADLRLSTFSVNYTNYSDRVAITVTDLRVVNDGGSSAGAYKVLCALSDTNVAGSSYWYMPSGTRWTSTGLAGGGTDTWSTGTETIYKAGITPSGMYYIVFRADCDGQVVESDENDNYTYSISEVVSIP